MLRRLLLSYGLFGIVVVFGMVAVSYGQEPVPVPAPEEWYKTLLKILFPALWTVGGPWLTGLVTSGFAKVPVWVQVPIATALSAIVGALAGVIPDFPLTIQSAAEMAGAGGGTGQILANMHPTTLQPKVGSAKNGG